MKINNKKRNLLKYRYCVRDTSEPKFYYADDRAYFVLIPYHRQKANQIKQKFGIGQRWGVLFKKNKDGTVDVYKWARHKGYYVSNYIEALATIPFCLAESERKGILK